MCFAVIIMFVMICGSLIVFKKKEIINIAVFLSIFIGIITCVVSWKAYSNYHSTSKIATETNIYSFDKESTTEENSFVLGYQKTNSVSYYYFFTKDKNGKYKSHKIQETKTLSVFYTDALEPQIIRYTSKLTKPNWFWAVGNFSLSNKYDRIVIFVPKNVVIKNI